MHRVHIGIFIIPEINSIARRLKIHLRRRDSASVGLVVKIHWQGHARSSEMPRITVIRRYCSVNIVVFGQMFCNVINDKCIFQPEEIQIFSDIVLGCKVGVFVRNIESKFILTQELYVDCIGIIYIRQRFINKSAYFRIKHRVKFLGLTVVFAG